MRTKITGVTVALLAFGLFAAGFGTAIFLRNTLTNNLDTQLQQLAGTDIVSALFSIDSTEGVITFSANSAAPATDYFVAIYGGDGSFIAEAGGGSAPPPVFPDTYTLEATTVQGTVPFVLPNSKAGPSFHASVAVFEVPGAGYHTQLVALPLAPVDRVVTQFISIYGILALITIIAGAVGTRLLVTLAFRSLTQVETTAMSIATGDFSQRMTDIEPRTEVGRLKIAINTMLGRIDGALSERDAALRQMRRFIGDASHELRTPLVTVRGYAELYRMGAITSDEDVAQAMDRIEKEAKRMGVLVEDLLALARLDERRDVVIGPVDLRPVARDAALDLRAAAPQRPVSVIDTTVAEPPPPTVPAPPVEPEPGFDEGSRRTAPTTSAIARAGATLSLLRRRPRPVPATRATGAGGMPPVTPIEESPAIGPSSAPPIVLGDENRIRQVVTNLLGNARRFTSEDSPIELKVGVDGANRMGWIEVIDHGEGIPEQVRDKIFQRFWRADTSRTRETGGAGLGLSIVSSIVEALHGSVEVGDTPGGGATFRVAFPLAAPTDAAAHLLIETQPLPMTRGSSGRTA